MSALVSVARAVLIKVCIEQEAHGGGTIDACQLRVDEDGVGRPAGDHHERGRQVPGGAEDHHVAFLFEHREQSDLHDRVFFDDHEAHGLRAWRHRSRGARGIALKAVEDIIISSALCSWKPLSRDPRKA